MQLGKVIGQAAPSIMDGVVEEDVRKLPHISTHDCCWDCSHILVDELVVFFPGEGCCQELGTGIDLVGLMLAPRSSVVSMPSYKVRYSPVAVTSLTAVVGTPVLAAIVLVG